MNSKDIKRFWQTPVSRVKVLDFESCAMNSWLEVTVLESRDATPGKDLISYRFSWRCMDVLAFRVMNEEQLEPATVEYDKEVTRSWTYNVVGSTWIEEFRAKTAVVDPEVKHFVIQTRDYIVEILSDKKPTLSIV